MSKLPPRADVVVIGAGFGGLAAALRLSELGAKVVVLEALNYPGGCASTFSRGGFRFESGATLFSGFGRGQLFRRWVDAYGLDVDVEWLDPVVELRAPAHRFSVPARRSALVSSFLERPDAPKKSLERFFEIQRRVADLLWGLLDEPELLPPIQFRHLLRHVSRAGDYLRVLPLVGKPLGPMLTRLGLNAFAPLRLYLDALCQITVQCPAKEAEALFALSTMDYFFRGTGHVRGGIGRLASGMVHAVRQAGGRVELANRVEGLRETGQAWRVSSRRGEIDADTVIANVLPQNLWELTGRGPSELPRVDALAQEVEDGWGACMLYRVVRPPSSAAPSPHHLQLIRDPGAPMVEGNHVFCSFSGAQDEGRAPEGYRTLTVSTHVPVAELRRRSLEEQGRYVSSVQASMRDTMSLLAPEWEEEMIHEETASPRTFERFTQRYLGYVGGIPRRAGLHNYRRMTPRPVLPGLYLVGDTVFPGQSTLATAIGGFKLAEYLSKPAKPSKH